MDATAALVRTLVEDVTGEPLVSVDHLPYGHQSVSFDVTLHDGTALIVRTNADRDVFRATLHNLAILRGLGLPVPRVLFHDLDQSRFPFADLVLERFPGRDLGYQLPPMTLSQMEAVADAVLDAQRRVRELPSAGGYGYVGIGEPGNRTTWAAVIDDIMRDDLTTKNVIVHEGRLSGFVDFDCVCYGDPLLQLGLTQTAVTSDGDERSRHYVEALFASAGLTPRDRRIVDLYPAVFGVEFLRDHPEVDEWSEHLIAKIGEWL